MDYLKLGDSKERVFKALGPLEREIWAKEVLPRKFLDTLVGGMRGCAHIYLILPTTKNYLSPHN